MASIYSRKQRTQYGAVNIVSNVAHFDQHFLPSLDLNRLQSKPSMENASSLVEGKKNVFQNRIEVSALERSTKKRCLSKAKFSEDKENQVLDLSLNLTPPGAKPNNECKGKSSSLSSTKHSSVSSASNGIEKFYNIDANKVPTLVVMGCSRCLMYVMAVDKDPRCPRCKKDGLLDFFSNPSHKKI
ncbi:hypothetical protein RJ641_005249 [Dillenia turbinata]|uniref:GIR1-like zinc ribbon domain-containing protein n=1 Tax=Dillenia turbinata TaxID=194707 RepID=A0AAN8VCF7_9MAGN